MQCAFNRGILEGEQQCPICGKEQDECNCTCQPEYMIDGVMTSCGQRCAVGSEGFGRHAQHASHVAPATDVEDPVMKKVIGAVIACQI